MEHLSKKLITGLPKAVLYLIKRKLFLLKSRKTQFTNIYRKGGFGPSDGLSGTGSDIVQTKVIMQAIPDILQKYQIKSMLDIPCGDLFWMQHVDIGSTAYTGADIVSELIKRNEIIHANSGKKFLVIDICLDPLPRVDLILCRDCFGHLKLNDAVRAVHNIKRSGSKFLLITTFPQCTKNAELGLNFFRPLNLCIPPFYFPQPLELISEGCTEDEGIYFDKSLGLWRIDCILIKK